MAEEEKPEPKPHRGFTLFLIALVVIACVVTVIPRFGAVTKVVLSDDTILTFETVTYGTHHTYNPGPMWNRFAAKHLGFWAHLWDQAKDRGTLTDPAAPVVWLKLRREPSGTNETWENFQVTTQTGQKLKIHARKDWHTPQDGHEVRGLRMINAPRREEFFTIAPTGFHQPSMKIPNPLFGRTWPKWNTESLPITNSVGGFDFVLRDAYLLVEPDKVTLLPTLETYRNGKQSHHWFGNFYMLSDATGNHSHMIPTNEPAWRVEVSKFKTKDAFWTTNEYVQFTVTNFPPAGTVMRLPIGTNVNGLDMEELWVGGEGNYSFRKPGLQSAMAGTNSHLHRRVRLRDRPPGDWDATVEFGTPWVALNFSAPRPSTWPVIVVQNSSGMAVQPLVEHGDGTMKRIWRAFGFDRKQLVETGPLTLTVYVRRAYDVTFTIDPAKLRREVRK